MIARLKMNNSYDSPSQNVQQRQGHLQQGGRRIHDEQYTKSRRPRDEFPGIVVGSGIHVWLIYLMQQLPSVG